MAQEFREQVHGNQTWPIDAVELVGDPDLFIGRTDMLFAAARISTQQHEGCLLPERADLPRRDVSYWTTKNDRGGMAILTDRFVVDTAADRQQREVDNARRLHEYELARLGAGATPVYKPAPTRFSKASAIFWVGPFDGAHTLRGNFVTRSCSNGDSPQPPPPDLLPEIVANESLLMQMGYRTP